MQHIFRLIDFLEMLTKNTAALCLLAMPLVTAVDVLGSKIFSSPLFGSEEIVAMLACITAGLTLPYAHSKGVHMGVDIVFSRLEEKHRLILTCTTSIVSFLLFVLVCWRLVLLAEEKKVTGTYTQNLHLPEHWVVYILATGFFVFCLVILKMLFTLFTDYRKRQQA